MIIFFLCLSIISASTTEDLHQRDYNDFPENSSELLRLPENKVKTSQTSSNTQKDYKYYTVEMKAKADWFKKEDFDGMHIQILEKHYRSFQEIKLEKPLPFYGQPVSKCLVTSGGFIHMDEFKTRFLSHSMYIAPLMADFSTNDTLQPSSQILIYNTEDLFIVWWENVRLNQEKKTPFTFQVVYYTNGTIIFNYFSRMSREILKMLKDSERHHNLNVGVSDANFYIKHLDINLHLHVMEPYHTIKISVEQLENISSIVFTPLPTCIEQNDCISCVEARSKFNLDCLWCKTSLKCSNSIDRFTQKWIEHDCVEPELLAETKNACLAPFNPLASFKNKKATLDMADIIKGFQQNKLFSVFENSTRVPHRLLGYKTLFTKFLWFILLMILFSTCILAVKNARDPNSFVGRWFIQNRVFNRFRRRRDFFSSGESSALGRIPINCSPNYVEFYNDDEPTELPQTLNSPNQNPPSYHLFQVVNGSFQEGQQSSSVAPYELNTIPLDDTTSLPNQSFPSPPNESSSKAIEPAVY